LAKNLQSDFRIGKWRIHPLSRRITSGLLRRLERRIEPKAMQVLIALAATPGQFRSKEDLLSDVWAGRAVGDESLTSAIYALRSAFEDDPRNPAFIETQNGVGYRLIASVQRRGLFMTRSTAVIALASSAAIAVSVFVLHSFEKTVNAEPQMVAVLPFVNLTGSQNDEYFASAMTDALITDLALRPAIRVISRTSVSHFERHGGTANELADELGADLLVEGSVQTVNGHVRIGMRLIDTQSNEILWAHNYNRSVDSTFTLQQEISNIIAGQIGTAVGLPERQEVTELLRDELSSFMRARFELATETVPAVQSALVRFTELSISRPDFAPAHLGVAESILYLFKASAADSRMLSRATESARRFETLAGATGASHRCLGQISLILNWDFAGAEKRYRKAILINPSDTIARRKYAWLLVAQRRYDEAETQIERTRLLDPLYYDNSELATLKLYSGDIDEAIEELERLDTIAIPSKIVLRTMAVAYLAAGREVDARGALVRMLASNMRSEPNNNSQIVNLGLQELFHRVLEEELFRSPIASAGFHSLLGDEASALADLEQAMINKDPHLIFIAALPELGGLHDHPRFQEMLASIGIEVENSPYIAHNMTASETFR